MGAGTTVALAGLTIAGAAGALLRKKSRFAGLSESEVEQLSTEERRMLLELMQDPKKGAFFQQEMKKLIEGEVQERRRRQYEVDFVDDLRELMAKSDLKAVWISSKMTDKESGTYRVDLDKYVTKDGRAMKPWSEKAKRVSRKSKTTGGSVIRRPGGRKTWTDMDMKRVNKLVGNKTDDDPGLIPTIAEEFNVADTQARGALKKLREMQKEGKI